MSLLLTEISVLVFELLTLIISPKSFSGRNQSEKSSPSSHLMFGELDENAKNARKDIKNCSKSNVSIFNNGCNVGDLPTFELCPDILGPETPATRPFVPGLKRVKEVFHNAEVKNQSDSFDSRKKAKCLKDLPAGKTYHGEISENSSSKFEWLNPSFIRDANGRRPDDPLYDKRTLYIPPDAMSKLPASQKQYWTVKCKYMDLVLFFKVVRL